MNGPDNRPLYQRLRSETDRYMLCIDSAGRERTRVEVLRSGADDAVSVPFTPDEIAARCHALLRRPREIRSDWDPVQPSTVALGPLVIDSGRHEIRLGEIEIPATRIEFSLLEHLCRRPTEVASRADLLESVWGPNWVGDTHVVDVHLSNLRRKLDSVAPDLRIVHTVRGVGFRISNELLDAAEAQASTGIPALVRNGTDIDEPPVDRAALRPDDTRRTRRSGTLSGTSRVRSQDRPALLLDADEVGCSAFGDDLHPGEAPRPLRRPPALFERPRTCPGDDAVAARADDQLDRCGADLAAAGDRNRPPVAGEQLDRDRLGWHDRR